MPECISQSGVLVLIDELADDSISINLAYFFSAVIALDINNVYTICLEVCVTIKITMATVWS